MKILLILVGLFSTFIGYCCCVAAGKIDRLVEVIWKQDLIKEEKNGT